MKKFKPKHEISIPNQPDVGYWPYNGVPNTAPLKDEAKKKERYRKLNAQRNKKPKK